MAVVVVSASSIHVLQDHEKVSLPAAENRQ